MDKITTQSITNTKIFTNRHARLCVFAAYMEDHLVEDSLLYYLKEILKICDGIIFIADNPICKSELEKIRPYVIYAHFEKHNKYDFGSYAIGFDWLQNTEYYNSTKEILFANDSVFGPYRSLQDFISKKNATPNAEFFGATKSSFGWKTNESGKVDWTFEPHVQSYFFMVTSSVFTKPYFLSFMRSVVSQSSKLDVIIKYEIGLSTLLSRHGHNMLAYCDLNLAENPTIFFIEKNKKMFFIKKAMIGYSQTYKANQIFRNHGYPFQFFKNKVKLVNAKERVVLHFFLIFELYRLLKKHIPFVLTFISWIKERNSNNDLQ